MNKTLLIFKHEFRHTIKRVGFTIMTLIVPVLALLAIGIFQLVSLIIDPSEAEKTTIGYVDEVGEFKNLFFLCKKVARGSLSCCFIFFKNL